MCGKVVAAVFVALALAGASVAATGLNPALRLDAKHTVRGSHFKPHELVRIVITADVERVRLIRATARGSFAALLPAPPDSCSHLLIRATGASGDGAVIRLPQGLCPPPSANGAPPQTDGVTPAADGVATYNLG